LAHVPSPFDQEIIREETPRDAKAEMIRHLQSFAFIRDDSRIILGFCGNRIGT